MVDDTINYHPHAHEVFKNDDDVFLDHRNLNSHALVNHFHARFAVVEIDY